MSPQVLALIQEQMRRLAYNESGGLLTFGVAGAGFTDYEGFYGTVGGIIVVLLWCMSPVSPS